MFHPTIHSAQARPHQSQHGGFKSGLRSPAIPDEAVIKRATQLSISETIKATFMLVQESGSFGFTFI